MIPSTPGSVLAELGWRPVFSEQLSGNLLVPDRDYVLVHQFLKKNELVEVITYDDLA